MLTDKAIRALKPRDTPYKAFDAKGLFLLVNPSGSRLWRYKYRFAQKEKSAAIGSYPEVSLADARTRLEELRRLLANGIDPSSQKRALKEAQTTAAANSFEVIALEWFVRKSSGWVPKHSSKIIERLKRDAFPWIGAKPIASITPPEVLQVLHRIEERGAIETAHRALGNLSDVFRYAIATGRATSDPGRDLRGALKPKVVRHFPAVTDARKVPALLHALDGYQGTHVVRCALRLAPLLFVRPGELRSARWADIDLVAAEWRFVASKTKQPHIVPLASQAVAILRELQPLTGRHELVFPSERSPLRPMSENTVNAALRSLGVSKDEMTGHGFRAMARTILEENLKFPAHLIEAQLAHAVRDPNGRAYNRTTHLAERHAMMQQWADHLDTLRQPSGISSVDPA